MKIKPQKSFFDEDDRLTRLSKLGDSLERLNNSIDWESFRPMLNIALEKEKSDPELGGRPPLDRILMFKTIILQRCNNLGDDKMEFLINDRLSFQRFLGLRLCDRVPDAKTIWYFKNELAKAGMGEKLFEAFEKHLEEKCMITHTGSIVDATFVDVPKQRNTREENKSIKDGETPQAWKLDEDMQSGKTEKTKEEKQKEHKLHQKDTDARWAKKNNETHYGYKNHAKVDKDSKLIVDATVTEASVHDSKEIGNLIDEKDKVVFADSAYVGEELQKEMKEKNPDIEIKIHEKGSRNKQLTEEQKKANNEKSKTRVRVEHVFGYMTNSMNGIFIRSIGTVRAKFNIMMLNLAYNMNRYAYLKSVAGS
jgi:IS5 family transposase